MPEESILEKMPLEKPEAYFDHSRNKYWLRQGERYVSFNKDDFVLQLNVLGYSRQRSKTGNASAAEKFLAELQLGVTVDFAGEMAGHRPGFLTFDSKNFLVTGAPKLVTPVKGAWETIKTIAQNLVGDEQMPYFLGWHACSVRALYSGEHTPGQVLVFAGPAGCGKSLWQTRVITPLLGNRMAKPLQYMNGGTTFNEDIIRAEHLVLEDENSNMDLKSRRALGSSIKNFTVNRYQRVHAKGKTAFTAPTWHRVSLSVNDEPENLCILPPQDESLKDKMMLLHCPEVFVYPEGVTSQKELEARIAAEVPAFLYYLLEEHVIADDLRHTRYGIKEYANPTILEAINGLAPETELLKMIDDVMFKEDEGNGARILSATELQGALIGEPSVNHQAKKIFSYPTACGVYLSRLAKSAPTRVVRYPTSNNRSQRWKLNPP